MGGTHCNHWRAGPLLALVALLCVPPAFADGGILLPEYVCPPAPPATLVDFPDGGVLWVLTPARERRLTCLMAACTEHRDACIEANAKGPPVAAIAGASAVATTLLLFLVSILAGGK